MLFISCTVFGVVSSKAILTGMLVHRNFFVQFCSCACNGSEKRSTKEQSALFKMVKKKDVALYRLC